jgi:hypothetical protein
MLLVKLSVGIVIVVITCLLARERGFNPWLWVLTAGVLGLVFLLGIPSAKAPGINDEERAKRRRTGDTVGGVISSIVAVLLVVVLILWRVLY